MTKLKSIVSVVLLASLAMAGVSQAATYKPGTYTATVTAHNAPMTVSVTVSANKIEAIDTSKNLETIGVGQVALEQVKANILKYQSLGVDTVTGATMSSMALLSAVETCLEQAGANIEQLEKHVQKPVIFNKNYRADVVIIGGGGTGLAAAVAAKQAGAKVIVVEKMGILGGSTNVSEGALNAADPKRQTPMGIEDSVQKHYQQTMEGGHNVGTPELVKYLSENAPKTIEWMESVGVTFKDEVGTATGALWQRSHYPSTPSGNSYVRAYQKFLGQYPQDVSILLNTQAKRLMRDSKGRVIGVEAVHNGKKVFVRASKGVIVATGGFGANIDLRQQVNTGVWKDVKLDSSIGSTNLRLAAQGEGIQFSQKIGADVIGMSDIQLHPCGTPGTGLMENIRTSGRSRVFVNAAGDRFVNEGAPRDTLCKAIFAQDGGTYWVVVNKVRYPDRNWVDRNGATIANMVAQKSVIEADTLDALAEKTGMKADKLKAAINQYNDVVAGKMKADANGFTAAKADKPMTEGPWYACKKVPTVHHTMGGLHINTDAQVIGADGKVIKGLYAAGEVTGGIHGSNRLGGNAIADVMTFGRAAGTNAAKGL